MAALSNLIHGGTSPVSSGAGGGTIVGYKDGQPIYSYNGQVAGVDTSGMGTKAQQAQAANNEGKAAAAAGDAAANNPAINPTLAPASNVTAPTTPAAGTGAPTYGTNSGPGILQQWFNERATGTDPAYEYTTGRGLKALDTAAAARGGFNGGASMQQDSDYLANMGAQRQSQLDALASGASNENANQVSQMLGLGMGLGSGEAGLAGQYDLGAGGAMTSANNTGLSLSGQAAMLPYLARQQMMSQLMGGGMGLLSSIL